MNKYRASRPDRQVFSHIPKEKLPILEAVIIELRRPELEPVLFEAVREYGVE